MIIDEAIRSEMDQYLIEGMKLAENKDMVLCIDRKRNKKITMGKMLEGLDEGSVMRANTARMMNNMYRYIRNMDETTRMLNIGDFDRFAFPIVRVLFPNLVLQDLASVQPMPQSIGMVFFVKFTYAQTKGSAVAGSDAFANPNEYYSDEEIDEEQIGTGDGATVIYNTPALSYTPIKPGTVNITFESTGVELSITDDGNGNLTGDVGAASTINYVTGAYSFQCSAAPDLGIAINANYLYNMEANTAVPQIDAQITSSPVRARTRKLRTLWSMEAAQDLLDQQGLNIETEQAGAMISKLKAEIDREGINDMARIATNTIAAWSRTPPAGVSYTEHKLSFLDTLVGGQNTIFNSTQIAVGNWMVGGLNVSTLVETLPGFIPAERPKNVRGIYKAGRIGDLDFYKDPNFQTLNATTGKMQLAPNSFMIGLKSDNMFETGYIHAPYIMAYTTSKIELDDFISRKGTASRYGKKSINGNFYCTGSITA